MTDIIKSEFIVKGYCPYLAFLSAIYCWVCGCGAAKLTFCRLPSHELRTGHVHYVCVHTPNLKCREKIIKITSGSQHGLASRPDRFNRPGFEATL